MMEALVCQEGIAPTPTLTVESLFRSHGAVVGRWALRLGGPSIEAEDVVQDVFLVVEKRLPSFRPDTPVTTWLYKITQNVVYQHRWKARWRRFWTHDPAAAERVPSAEPPPPKQLEQRETQARIYRILDQMSEKRRTVLILFEWERLSGEEIARRMDAKVSTVWVWLHRARVEFIERMKALEAEEELG